MDRIRGVGHVLIVLLSDSEGSVLQPFRASFTTTGLVLHTTISSANRAGAQISRQTLSDPGELIHPSPLGSPGLVAWPSRATGTGEKAGSV